MTVPSLGMWDKETLAEDGQSAFERFYGKSNDEMQSFFHSNVISGITYLSSIPRGPFQYYIKGICQYINGDNLNKYEACAAASGFLDLISYKIEEDFEVIESILPYLYPTIDFIGGNQKVFNADEQVYGDFSRKAKEIKETIFKLKNGI